MKLVEQTESTALLSYGEDQASLELKDISKSCSHGKISTKIQ